MAKLSKSIATVLERTSKAYMDKHLDKYLAKAQRISREFHDYVRGKLSVKYIKGKKNTSLFPKLRTGKLRGSAISLRPTVSKRKKLSNGRFQAQIRFPNYFRKLSGNSTDDYGEELNSADRFKKSTFTNWKERLRDNLAKRVQKRLKGV